MADEDVSAMRTTQFWQVDPMTGQTSKRTPEEQAEIDRRWAAMREQYTRKREAMITWLVAQVTPDMTPEQIVRMVMDERDV